MSSTKVMRFTAEWSDPCKEYLSIFTKVVGEFKDLTIESYDIETDCGVEMASDYGIKGVPTTIIFKDDEYSIKVGVVPEADLRKALDGSE
jgi:thiol-disulfide isomerase/thioredoxin